MTQEINSNKFDNSTVSIIVRTASTKRLPLLLHALESVINNDYRPIEIIIVIQSENQDFIQKVKDLARTVINNQLQYKIVINYTSEDERAKNLNLGIQAATGRYIGFLDDDDILYSHHVSSLVAVLNSSEIPWVYADHCSVMCDSSNYDKINILSKNSANHKINNFSLEKLCENGFIPLHTYLIDRTKVESDIFKVDESFQVLEDYVFMLKLAHRYLPQYLPIITCEYRFYTDASNSNYLVNQGLGLNYSEKAKIWSEAQLRVEKFKKELFPQYKTKIFSSNMRSIVLARFAFLYKLRPFYRKIKNFITKRGK